MPKATAEELKLHTRVLDGDNVAISQVFVRYGDDVVEHLKKYYPKVVSIDLETIYESVTDAFISYNKYPERYDPERMTLFDYLKMLSEGDMKNIIERKINRKKKEGIKVELNEEIRNSRSQEIVNPEDELITFEIKHLHEKQLRKLFGAKLDYEIAKLVIDGVRETTPYAEILGAENLEKSEREAEVKRAKDRVKIRIKRAYDKGYFKN